MLVHADGQRTFHLQVLCKLGKKGQGPQKIVETRNALRGNAEGRHGTVIGRRRFALGRPRWLEPGNRGGTEVRLGLVVSFHFMPAAAGGYASSLCWSLAWACDLSAARGGLDMIGLRTMLPRAYSLHGEICPVVVVVVSAWHSLRRRPGQGRSGY